MRSKRSVHVAVVLQPEIDLSDKPLARRRARCASACCSLRERDAGDMRAAKLGEIERQARPSRSRCRARAGRGCRQQLGREMALLGELGVVERLVAAFRNRRSYIAGRHRGTANRAGRRDHNDARHCAARAARGLNCVQPAIEITQQPLRPRPVRPPRLSCCRARWPARRRSCLARRQAAVHVGFAELAARDRAGCRARRRASVNRTATGVPVPSPNVNVDPSARRQAKISARINFSNAARSNRSIGRLPHASSLSPATPATQLESTRRRTERMWLRPPAAESHSDSVI